MPPSGERRLPFQFQIRQVLNGKSPRASQQEEAAHLLGTGQSSTRSYPMEVKKGPKMACHPFNCEYAQVSQHTGDSPYGKAIATLPTNTCCKVRFPRSCTCILALLFFILLLAALIAAVVLSHLHHMEKKSNSSSLSNGIDAINAINAIDAIARVGVPSALAVNRQRHPTAQRKRPPPPLPTPSPSSQTPPSPPWPSPPSPPAPAPRPKQAKNKSVLALPPPPLSPPVPAPSPSPSHAHAHAHARGHARHSNATLNLSEYERTSNETSDSMLLV